MSKTIGESRVRTEFNPSANSKVDQIKQKTADLINICDDITDGEKTSEEQVRLSNIAQDRYEEAAMWAVKAATA